MNLFDDDSRENIWDMDLVCLHCKNSCPDLEVLAAVSFYTEFGRVNETWFCDCLGFLYLDECENEKIIRGDSTSTEVY